MSFDFIDRKFAQKPKDEPPPEECPLCFDGGWECYAIGVGDPHFRECSKCHNPKGYRSP